MEAGSVAIALLFDAVGLGAEEFEVAFAEPASEGAVHVASARIGSGGEQDIVGYVGGVRVGRAVEGFCVVVLVLVLGSSLVSGMALVLVSVLQMLKMYDQRDYVAVSLGAEYARSPLSGLPSIEFILKCPLAGTISIS